MAILPMTIGGGGTPFDYTTHTGFNTIGTSTITISTTKKILFIACAGTLSTPIIKGTMLASWKNTKNSSYNQFAYIFEPDNGEIKLKGTDSTFGQRGAFYFELDDVIY